MTETCLSRDYRGSIALNNMAVLLLTNGHLLLAHETLVDSLELIKASSKRESKPCTEVDMIIQRGSQRLANSFTSCTHRFPVNFRVVADDSDFSIVAELLKSTTLSKQPSLIRFEEYGCERSYSERDIDIDSAIILHNYALSCLALSLSTEPSLQERARKLNHDALKLLELAQMFINCRAQKDRHGCLMQKIFVVAAFVTFNKAQSFLMLQNETKAKECLDCLRYTIELATTFMAVDYTLSQSIGGIAPAA